MQFLQKCLIVSCVLALAFLAICSAGREGGSRIINGQLITVDKTPYIVQLTDRNGWSFCGGALISQYHVLTASHCFNTATPENTVVVAGVTYTYEQGGVHANIVKLIKHPEYTKETLHSDVAILKLDRPMYGKNIVPISLCQQPVPVNGILQVSGWGRTEAGSASNQLRTTRVPVRDPTVCRQEFGNFVKKNMICVSGYQATGTCFGDSGGPAVYNNQVCGVVAFAYECGAVGYTTAFTDIQALRTFIEGAMRQ